MRPSLIFILFIFLTLIGCSGGASKTAPTIYTAGDKATVGALVYNLTDAESTTALGDDPANLRTPLNRFYLIRISVSNSGADEQPIPSMSLVDDSGQMYPELADGTGVTNWLGVVRKVAGAQTEQGMVAFDAPMKHYRLRLNDAFDDKEVAIDIPLSFVRVSAHVVPPATGTITELPKK